MFGVSDCELQTAEGAGGAEDCLGMHLGLLFLIDPREADSAVGSVTTPAEPRVARLPLRPSRLALLQGSHNDRAGLPALTHMNCFAPLAVEPGTRPPGPPRARVMH